MSELTIWSLSTAAEPLFWCALLVCTCLAITAFPHRLNGWLAVSVLLVPAHKAFQTGEYLSSDYILNDIYLRFVIMLTSHIIHLSFRDATPGSGLERKSNSKTEALLSGYKLLFNGRGVGTSWELPYLWPGVKYTEELHPPAPAKKAESSFKKASVKSTVAAHSRAKGIMVRVSSLLIKLLLIMGYHDWLRLPELLHIDEAVDYAPEKEGIVRRLVQQIMGLPLTTPVTWRELVVRAHGAVDNFLPDYLVLSACHDFFAILFLAVGLDQSWEWPPLLGRITEAYTMRRFWSMFWHRLIYRSFNSHAAAISTTLGVSQGTALSRLFNNCLVFFLSSVMHGAVSWRSGTMCPWTGNMKYWLIQPVAFAIEGVVQSFWGRFRRKRLSWVRPSALVAFERTVGYAWVCTWLMWEAPKRSFTLLNCEA